VVNKGMVLHSSVPPSIGVQVLPVPLLSFASIGGVGAACTGCHVDRTHFAMCDWLQSRRLVHDLLCWLRTALPDRTELLCNRRRSTILLLGCTDHQPAAAHTCTLTAFTFTCC
jgi:hypothetical protein